MVHKLRMILKFQRDVRLREKIRRKKSLFLDLLLSCKIACTSNKVIKISRRVIHIKFKIINADIYYLDCIIEQKYNNSFFKQNFN